MSENLEDKKKDIKPERPDISSGRSTRRTRGGGFLFSSFITILNLAGLIILFLWFFNTSGNQQQAGQNFIERISSLEESLANREEQIEDLTQNIDADIKFINKEIRKLWDLSNKRNRKNISANLNSIEDIKEQLKEIKKQNETLSAKQRALNLELAKTANIIEKVDKKIEGIDTSSTTNSGDDKFNDIQESLDSFNAYRIQVNQSLISIKDKLNKLELIIEDTQKE
tara:strand:- start:2798 stop:3475 length:678 start_codon:yes stop_codon:yes gene_type:complete